MTFFSTAAATTLEDPARPTTKPAAPAYGYSASFVDASSSFVAAAAVAAVAVRRVPRVLQAEVAQPADIISKLVQRPGHVAEMVDGRQHREKLRNRLALDVTDNLPRDVRSFQARVVPNESAHRDRKSIEV